MHRHLRRGLPEERPPVPGAGDERRPGVSRGGERDEGLQSAELSGLQRVERVVGLHQDLWRGPEDLPEGVRGAQVWGPVPVCGGQPEVRGV